jgi:hypothetical protein
VQYIFVSDKYRNPKTLLRTLLGLGGKEPEGGVEEEGEDAA